MLWIFPLLVGAILWSAADTISDQVISDETLTFSHDIEEDEDEDVKNSRELKPKEAKLNGEQDAAISGLVMAIFGLFLHFGWVKEPIFDLSSEVVWLALIAGGFQCISLIYLLKAFENSSSTVIVPLMQLNAIFVLPFSLILTALSWQFEFLSSHHRMIKPLHLVAFSLIFFGGFYPASEGNLSRFFQKEFWKKKAVVQVLISDAMIALYYVLVSACTSESAGLSELNFMVLSIWGNFFCFLALFVVVPTFRNNILAIGKIDNKFLLLSGLGEVLSISGYFSISFSYAWYYNSGVVSAAEGALNQFFNLILAIVFKKYFNFGRTVENIRSKLLSCVFVSIGLILASIE